MNQEKGFVENYLNKRNVGLTPKGRKWAENFEGVLIALFFLSVIALVGFIEGYGNH